ncbi:MAG TPA: hypothetical protein VKN35_07925 [Xanthomonadales bacterium]|nr:hypothetical protein [Xanthomonadales bacterium]
MMMRAGAMQNLALVLLLLTSSACQAEDEVPYQPVAGDKAVTYLHRFKPEDYAHGLEMLKRGFGQTLNADGRNRRTFFLENPLRHEVLVTSFFHSDSSVEDWTDTPAQTVLLEQLKPMHREPVVMREYTVGLHE